VRLADSNALVRGVAADDNGNFAVLYKVVGSGRYGNEHRVQRFNASGASLGKVSAADPRLTNGEASIAMDASGDFVVVWDEADGSSFIYGQRFSSAGKKVGGRITLHTTSLAAVDWQSNVAMDALGNFAVSWWSRGQNTRLVQGYRADGVARGGSIQFGAGSGDSQAAMSMTAGGDLVMSWATQSLNGVSAEVYGQRLKLTVAGQPTDGVAQVDAEPFLVNTTLAGDQQQPSAALAGSGSFIVAWSGKGLGDDAGVFAQQYVAPAPPPPPPPPAGLTAAPASGLTTSEGGASAGFDVVLNTQPTGNVDIAVSSSDTTEGVVSVSMLTFTPNNWDEPQRVTVTGVNDTSKDGNVGYTVTLSAASGDPAYNGKTAAVSLTNTDNEKGGGPNHLSADQAGDGTAETLTAGQADPLVAEALARWEAAGVDTSGLGTLVIHVTDLPGAELARATGRVIHLDADAAGWGWFVDATPGDDSEFLRTGDQGEAGRMDLLSVLVHEIGHLLGLDHGVGDVMQPALSTGVRRMPTPAAAEENDDSLVALFSDAEFWNDRVLA
jgi:hypothetical protein